MKEKFYATDVKNKEIAFKANTMTNLKQKLSNYYNNFWNVFDKVIVCCSLNNKDYQFVLTRYNTIYPNNTIIRGRWK